MPILNYTTEIAVEKTVMEIQRALAKSGAKSISIDYDDQGLPEAVTFLVRVDAQWINFRLPSSHEGIKTILENDQNVPRRYKNADQAKRISWRITKSWVDAQLAIIEARQAEMAEVFLPYAVMESGRTLFQDFKNNPMMLGSGKDDR